MHENNYQYEQGIQSGNDAVWRCCVLSNMECYTQNHTKMLHYTAGFSSCLVNITTYISQQVFCIEYEQHTNLLTILSMTTAHKKNKSYLPIHSAIFVWKFHSWGQLNCIKSCHLLKQNIFTQTPWTTQCLQTCNPSHSSVIPIKQYHSISKSHNSEPLHSSPYCCRGCDKEE
jgi:hypothetical protein